LSPLKVDTRQFVYNNFNGVRMIAGEKMPELQIKLDYEWKSVYLRDNVEYLFPMAISPFMRSKYKGPAVFKWEIYQKVPGDKKLVYIGEAQELCPQRLYGYLNPGPTQLANKKVNMEFRGYLRENLKIRLETCEIKEIYFGKFGTEDNALSDKHVRRLVAEALIVEHRKRGFTVADL
jgi:hypothetical protein